MEDAGSIPAGSTMNETTVTDSNVQAVESEAPVPDPATRIVELEEHVMLLTRRAATARDSVINLRNRRNALKMENARLQASLDTERRERAEDQVVLEARHEGFLEAAEWFVARIERARDLYLHLWLGNQERALKDESHVPIDHTAEIGDTALTDDLSPG